MNIKTYPDSFAEAMKSRAGEKYRPSNGTEGRVFRCNWCENCAKDLSMSEGKDFDDCDDSDSCGIIADTLAYSIDDPRYPTEWQYGRDGQPMCTAYVPYGQQIPAPRCPNTIDMFSDDGA